METDQKRTLFFQKTKTLGKFLKLYTNHTYLEACLLIIFIGTR